MLGRKGFTLIELLIVVTILSILAGAAVPYVQDYVDESKRARARVDLDEIRNALIRYEIERGASYVQPNIASLIGPYISKSLADPWGAPYVVRNASSSVFSFGADGKEGGGDDIVFEYRPHIAVSRVYWIDTNQNGIVDVGDSLNLKLTRPSNGAFVLPTGLVLSAGTAMAAVCQWPGTTNRIASYALPGPAFFTPGSDTLAIGPTNIIVDGNTINLSSDKLTILAQ